MNLLTLESVPALQAEVRALAAERGAVILAHNYQVPEVQDVADFVGDSLGLSQQAAKTEAEVIVFCGVHFMAETATVLSPEKTVLLPDLDAGCSLADSITADAAARVEGQAPRRGRRDVRQHDGRGEGRDRLLRDVLERRRRSSSTSTASTVPTPRSCSGPDMFLGAYVEKQTGRKMHVWDGECHVHAGIRPSDISDMRASHPGADFLIHPECGCSTSVMEYVAAGDVASEGVHMLSTGGMLTWAAGARGRDRDHGHRDRHAAPAADGAAGHRLRGRQRGGHVPLHEDDHAAEAARHAARQSGVVKVPEAIAERARLPIERMVAIG